MNFFEKLEAKFSRFAIRNLMLYMCVFYVIGFVLMMFDFGLYVEYFSLDIARILKGEVWRLITWLFYPVSFSPIFAILLILTYYSLGNTLERIWGSFKFNVFILMGCFFHIVAAVILYILYEANVGLEVYNLMITPDNMSLSIFLAFAATFPDAEFALYFVIRVKAKYLAIFYVIIQAYIFISGDLSTKITVGLSLLNVAIFFLMTKRPGRVIVMHRHPVAKEQKRRVAEPRHRCAVCGKTELDDENEVFRYCSKCNGNYEYCSEHLYTHKHVE